MSSLALVLGMVLSLFVSLALKEKLSKWVGPLLKLTMVGLGFGLTCRDFLTMNSRHVGLVFLGIGLTLILGYLIGKCFKMPSSVAILITVGTAICGGTAIAAVSPLLKARNQDAVVSLAAVFLLNSIAMLIFPVLGHAFSLSQTDFGVWAGIAIHDTSSVIGAAGLFGDDALKTAVMVKAMRILFIIPIVLGLSVYLTRKATLRGMPWFLWAFMGAILLNLVMPSWATVFARIYIFSKYMTVLPIFLMGLSFSLGDLRLGGVRPFAYATTLWLCISGSILCFLLRGL